MFYTLRNDNPSFSNYIGGGEIMKTIEMNQPIASQKVLTGAKMLVEAFKEEGVELIFGYPGGAVLNIYDALYDSGISHMLTRHEQGAIHAAQGYAKVSGKPGVVIATSGPGATNLVTGIADAMMDSLPLIVITGQVNTQSLGTDAFQEAPILGITTPITKHNFQVNDINRLGQTIKEAFYIATTGRQGPVLIDIPKDITAQTGIFDYSKEVNLPGYIVKADPKLSAIKQVAHAIKLAKKPIILAGAGIMHANATEELRKLVERTNIPVANTLLGLGTFPQNHPRSLGMAGMHGTYTANMALYEADLIINIGSRFDDRLTGSLKEFAKFAKVIHFDIDPSEIGKNVATDIAVVGDAKDSLKLLLKENLHAPDNIEWLGYLQQLKKEYPLWYIDDGKNLKPQRLIQLVYELTNGKAIVATDVGQHQMWTAQFYPFNGPNKLVTSGGLGTMGFGLPAAIGAQASRPQEPVIAILGDASFQMTLQELAILNEYNLPVKIIIVNNRAMGMVRQWQQLFYKKRLSQSLLPNQLDYEKLAEAFGIQGVTIDNEEDFVEAFKQALATDKPCLINCQVNPLENVYPMVPAGKGLNEMEGVKP